MHSCSTLTKSLDVRISDRESELSPKLRLPIWLQSCLKDVAVFGRLCALGVYWVRSFGVRS